MWVRQGVAVSLLLLFGAFYSAPVAKALQSGLKPGSHCCKTGHSCCRKNDQRGGPGAAWVAASNCPNQCQGSANLNSYRGGPASVESVSVPGVETRAQRIARGISHSFLSSYLAFLYQRPPPSR